LSFKNKRKALFRNEKKLALLNYQYVIVNVENGLDIGTIVSFGKCAESKLHSKYHDKEPIYNLLRHARLEDMEKHKQNLDDIPNVLITAREYVEKSNMDMKITDAEWQLDRMRLTVFFTAPMRIDFRQFVKDLAGIFRTRIELRQISTREDAKRIGGMGSCGRSLCCSTFCGEHCHVTLEHAKTQQLSNNVTKLSGYCGRLKCCLLYEFKTYVDIFKNYPPMDSIICFPEGKARILKADIFKELVHAYIPEVSTYKTISFEEFCLMHRQGKVQSADDNGKVKELRRMLIDPDEADLDELKHLED
jgi:cell fate regulator YaaT (PSP1 superfamily)